MTYDGLNYMERRRFLQGLLASVAAAGCALPVGLGQKTFSTSYLTWEYYATRGPCRYVVSFVPPPIYLFPTKNMVTPA